MAVLRLPSASSIAEACLWALELILSKTFKPDERLSVAIPFREPLDARVFLAINGVRRSFYQSPHSNQQYFGLGTALLIDGPKSVYEKELLEEDQYFFWASRFDEQSIIGEEWQGFNHQTIFLPLLSIVQGASKTLWLNHVPNENVPIEVFFDQAQILLNVIAEHHNDDASFAVKKIFAHEQKIHPSKEHYRVHIDHILSLLSTEQANRKIVIGRRHELSLHSDLDPWELFWMVRAKNQDAHLFFLDNGNNHCFFGASPEILFTLKDRLLTSVAVAGTRTLHGDQLPDNELITSAKDNREHGIVVDYLHSLLKPMAVDTVTISPVDILKTSCVKHLRRTFTLRLDDAHDEYSVIKALHPTPAVCGYEPTWAKEYIRHHEGFDRGYFAGPVGIIGKNYSEIAVGIRSALCDRNKLYVYAASGIVDGSMSDEEWCEMENKERTILRPLGL